MAGAKFSFRLYALVICDHAPAQRNVEDSDFVSAVPHSSHHTMGTASWQNHDSNCSPPQSVIILHCHVCLGLSNPYISSALWRQCLSKNTTHLPGHGYPRPAQGLGWSSGNKLLVHYLKLIMHFEWKFSSQPPPKLYWPQTQNTTSDDILINLFPSTFPPHH